MTTLEIIKPFDDRYSEYLRDESKMTGTAKSISFPETKEDVINIIQNIKDSTPITIQGSRTGIYGGAVPIKGHIMNLSKMNKIIEYFEFNSNSFIKVQPGVTLADLKKELSKKGLFWPPESTETTATIGGVIATNAQGINMNDYQDTSYYIEELCVINSQGQIINIKRGEHKFFNNQCKLPHGKVLTIDTKLLGYKDNVDLIDIYVGSEGMYGVIVECTLRLVPIPNVIWGLGFFFQIQDDIYQFAEKMKNINKRVGTARITAIEYIDKTTLKYIEEFKQVATKVKELPEINKQIIGMIYIEIHGEEEADIESIAETLMDMTMEYNIDPDTTWALSTEDEIEKIRAFRHVAPESIYTTIEKARHQDNRITKLGTDIKLESTSFKNYIEKYQKDASKSGIEVAIFGHVIGNHVHIYLLPKNYEDYIKGKQLCEKWEIEVAEENGKLYTDHGVGKIKKDLFSKVTNKKILDELKSLKEQLDSSYLWNPGNMLN